MSEAAQRREALAAKVAELPESPGVYLLKDEDGRILYVGKATSLRDRVRSYLAGPGERPHLAPYLKRWRDVQTIVTATVAEALVLENSFIKKERPPANVRLRDDKRYLCLRIDLSHDYPRITLVRRFQKDGALYFGPYADAGSLRESLRALREIFPLRSCTDHTLATIPAPCLYYQLKRCAAPCHGHVTKEAYGDLVKGAIDLLRGRRGEVISGMQARMVEESAAMRFENAAVYRDRLRALERTLERQHVAGASDADVDVVALGRSAETAVAVVLFVRDGAVVSVREIPLPRAEGPDGDLVGAFVGQFYDETKYVPDEVLVSVRPEDGDLLEAYLSELRGTKVAIRVPQRGTSRELLEMAQRNADLALTAARRDRETVAAAHAALGRMAGLVKPPESIECFDISHFQGREVVASMVRFVDGRPDRQSYRRYRIREIPQGAEGPGAGNDDFASMNEVLRRRYREGADERLSRPDLVVVDGGKGQLASAVAALDSLGWGGAPVIGLAKARAGRPGTQAFERIFRPGESDAEVPRPDAPETLLLARIRDEAHRFAITYHRKLRSQAAVDSALDAISGVGDRWRQELLRKFGSVQGIRDASLEDLLTVPGLGRTRALRIQEHLRDV